MRTAYSYPKSRYYGATNSSNCWDPGGPVAIIREMDDDASTRSRRLDHDRLRCTSDLETLSSNSSAD